jgi:hypothetical protein
MDIYMKEAIEGALDKLDEGNDNHWTKLGLPSIEAVNALMSRVDAGDEKASRSMIEAVRPGFVRYMAVDEPERDDGLVNVDEEDVPAPVKNPIVLMEEFCQAMQADGGKWQRYCPPLYNIMLQYLASEPTVRDTYLRANARGRL